MTSVRENLNRVVKFQDLREVPAYGIPEAAHYLLIPTATLRSWVLGRSYPTKAGKKRAKEIIHLPDRDIPQLSFFNLVEAHVLSALRREHRVPFEVIRRAVRYVEQRFQTKHPLIALEFQTDGVGVFIDALGDIVDASAGGQVVMRRFVEEHLQRIDRDAKGIACRLYPFTRGYREAASRSVVIDPQIAFGRPVLRGTRIPTAEIAERCKAGDSIAELANDYRVSQHEIEEALRCELRVEAA